MTDDLNVAIQDAANALRTTARAHKRASAHHRRQAREAMHALNRLRQICEQHGIELDVIGGEESTHGRESPRDRTDS